MSLRIVGAGLGRTGTLSLKLALERLLGAPCYHMMEVFVHPEHVAQWHAAAVGDMPDWHALLKDYAATVDWPAAAFWREISQAFTEALVLLSFRDAEAWWQSAHATIFPSALGQPQGEWRAMIDAMFANRFTSALDDRDACIAAYERHNAHVRATVPRDRLLEWSPGDGWQPICNALGIAAPEEPFPKVNTKEEFLNRQRSSA
jgi:hypothetical protein